MPAADETETTLIRCHAYVCTLMARACARQHIDAKQTSAMNRDACIDCPAGAARAKAFVAGGARCPVPVDGKSCPDQPRIGSMYCERHRFHVGAIHRRSEPASEDVVVHRKRGRPPVAKPVIKPRPKPAPKPTPRVTNTCGDCGRGHLSPRPYCFQCVANAKEALRRRDRPDDWNAVVEWLAIPRAERFPKRDARTVACDRCGKERRVRSGGRTSQVGNWCGDCIVLANLMQLPEMKPFLAAHFEIVKVDIGRFDKNLQIPARFGAAEPGERRSQRLAGRGRGPRPRRGRGPGLR